MTLRRKVLALTAVTIVGLFAALATIVHAVWYSNFDSLETARAALNLRRVAAALADDAEKLSSTATDWAEWDDTYAFVEDLNEEFVGSNVQSETHVKLGVDVIAIVNAAGTPVLVRAVDRISGEPFEAPADVVAAVTGTEAPLLRADGVRGIVAFSDRVALAASRPILTSQRNGTPRGHLVLVRFLDDAALAALAKRTHVALQAFRADAASFPPDVAAAETALRADEAVHVQTLDEETIAAYSAVRDVAGNPALILRIAEPRSIRLQARSGLNVLLGGLLATGVVFGGLTLLVLERFVLSRLHRLSDEARDVGSTQDLTRRVSAKGSDELAATAAAINTMLDSLEKARLEREQSEAALRASEELLLQSHKMEAIGRLAGGLAHDFNNLLVVMIGHADLLSTKLRAQPSLLHHADEIQRAGERAASLTRRLLAFSGKQALHPEVVDLNRLIGQNEDMLRRLVGSDVELVRVPEVAVDGVLVDPDQMAQVLVNLAANARDALPRGGRVTIDTVVVEFDRETDGVPAGRWVRLRVADDGIGMDADTVRHAFEPFFTTKAPGRGTGLGLASVHGIVSQAGGHVRIDSALGSGTEFRIYLPAVAGAAAPAGAPAPGSHGGGSETVLLVDDEPAVRMIAAEALSVRGYQVLQADGAEAAIRLAHASQVHIGCLVTDVLMPRVRGPELARTLRGEQSDLRVLYMSGYPDDPDVRTAVAAGAAFLQKPFTPDGLARSVRGLLDDRSGSARGAVVGAAP